MQVFHKDDYLKAANCARQQATKYNREMLLLKTKEYNRTVFTVSFATKADADYYRGEIIKPGEPLSQGVTTL